MPLLEDALAALLGQAPLAAIILIVLFYELKAVRGETKAVRKEVGGEISALKRSIDSLRAVSLAAHRFVIDYMALKGLFTMDEASFLERGVKSIVGGDPFTEEEMAFIRSVLSKHVDDITLEEAEKLEKIFGEKWMKEGDVKALEAFYRASAIRGYVLQKALRKR